MIEESRNPCLVLEDVEIKRKSKSSGGQFLDRDIGTLSLHSIGFRPRTFIIRVHWVGDKVPLCVMNGLISNVLPMPLVNQTDPHMIHLVVKDNSSWKDLELRQFVLKFRHLHDAASFLALVKTCFDDEQEHNDEQEDNDSYKEDQPEEKLSNDGEEEDNSKHGNEVKLQEKEDINEEEEMEFTQQWPHSPLL